MKDKILGLLRTPTDDTEYPTPLTFERICESLGLSNAERFKAGSAIIELVVEGKVVQLGDLYGVDAG